MRERALLGAGLRALASAKGLTLVLVHHPLPTPRKIREMTIKTRITVAMVMSVLFIPGSRSPPWAGVRAELQLGRRAPRPPSQ
jgi:hypothetical protein